MAKRLTRPEQAARTRQRLLRSARATFTRRGFHATSLEEIAADAGFTKGAIYARFASKADLFFALLEELVDARVAEIRQVADSARDAEAAAASIGRQLIERLRSDLGWSLLVIEFRVHAARDPVLARRFGELNARFRAAMAFVIAEITKASPTAPRVEPEDLARCTMALASGIALERAVDGDAFAESLAEDLGASLMRGVSENPGERRR